MKIELCPSPSTSQTPYILQRWDAETRRWTQFTGVFADNDEQAIEKFRRFVPAGVWKQYKDWNLVKVLAFSVEEQ